MSSGHSDDWYETKRQIKTQSPVKDGKTWLRHPSNRQTGQIDLMVLAGKFTTEQMVDELVRKKLSDPNVDNKRRKARVIDHIDHLQRGSTRSLAHGQNPHNLRIKNVNGKWRFDPDSPEFHKEIEGSINKVKERRLNTNDTEDISNAHATTAQKIRISAKSTLGYKIVDDHTYANVIRIRTKWKGKNRLLWVNKREIDEFFSHPEKFKVIPELVDTGKQCYETGGRIKLSGRGTVMRWNACVVKKRGLLEFLFGK